MVLDRQDVVLCIFPGLFTALQYKARVHLLASGAAAASAAALLGYGASGLQAAHVAVNSHGSPH
jgi:hypothetical protein